MRNLYEELKDGFDALREERNGKIVLKKTDHGLDESITDNQVESEKEPAKNEHNHE